MCNCIKETTVLIKRDIALLNPKIKGLKYAVITRTMSEHPKVLINVLLGWDETLKNGKIKSRETNQTVVATYCPFCGIKY